MAYIGTTPLDVRSFGTVKFEFTAAAGQTAFTGSDDNGKTLGFTEGQIEVYVNGVLMDSDDFTTSGGNTVTLGSAAAADDIITVNTLKSNAPITDYVQTTGGTFTGGINVSSGNVGLGFTAPPRPLSVYNDTLPAISLHTSASGNGNGDGFQIQANSTDAYVWNYENTPIRFGTNGAERMQIASTGELLVGTTSDTMPAAAAAGQAIMAGTRTFIATETGGDTILGGTTGSNFTAFYQGGTERMRIDGSGNVGIGTTSPSTNNGVVTKLVELQSTNNISITGTTNTAGYNGLLLEARLSGRSPQPRYAQIGMASDTSGNGSIGFYTAVSGGYVTESMKIDDNGRVTMARQPSFHAGVTSTVSYSSGETVVFQTAYHNRGNHYNTSTGVFTAPVAGVYSFTVRMLHQGASNGFQVDSLVSRNDTSSAGYAFLMQRHKYQADYTGFGGYLWEATSGQVFLAANDTLRVKYGGAQGTQIHANPSWSYFCGHLIG